MKKTLLRYITLFIILGMTQSLGFAQDYTQWHLPEGATTRLGKGKINDIVFSPDGTQFAVATTIGTWIYDAQTGKENALLTGHEVAVMSVVFSPDGQTLISADSSGQSRRWDVTSSEQLSILTEGNDIVEKVALSADSTKLVTMSLDDRFRLWDLNNPNTEPIVIDDIEQSVDELEISPDGKFIATTKIPFHSRSDSFVENYRLQVWNLITEDLLINLPGEKPRFTSLKFSVDGKTLITSDSNGEIQLWNVENGSTRLTIKGNEKGTRTLAFAPHSKLLASGDWDYKIRLWDISAEAEQSAPRKILEGHKFGPSASAFSPDEKTLLTASEEGLILAWDIETGKQRFKITGHIGGIQQLAFSDTGETLISANSFASTELGWRTQLRHWEMNDSRQLSSDFFEIEGIIAISPHFRTCVLIDKDGNIGLWNIETKSIQNNITEYKLDELNYKFTFSSDGKMVAASDTENRNLHLWKITNSSTTIQPWKTLVGHLYWVRKIAFSLDGKMLACDDGSKTIPLWNLVTDEILFTFTEHGDHTKAISISPDGNTLTAGTEEAIYLWNIATGKQINICIPDVLAASMILHFSPDSKILISACGGTIHEFAPGEVRRPDGGMTTKFSSIQGGGTFQLWDVQTGELLSTHAGHKNFVKTMAFSKDGKTLATGSWDGTILLWDWEKIVSDR